MESFFKLLSTFMPKGKCYVRILKQHPETLARKFCPGPKLILQINCQIGYKVTTMPMFRRDQHRAPISVIYGGCTEFHWKAALVSLSRKVG